MKSNFLSVVFNGGTGQVWADGDRVIMGWASGKHAAISLATATDPRLVSLNAYQMRSIWPELKDQEGK